MRRLAWTLLVLTILVGAMIWSLSPVDAYQYKSGYINENTTWTKDEGPYRLTGTLYVNPGVILTIEPGTVVDFYSYNLYVYGTLNCRGTSDNKIVLYSSATYTSSCVYFQSSPSWNETTSSGCIIDNAVLSSTRVSVTNCSPKISNNLFTASAYTALQISSNSSPISLPKYFRLYEYSYLHKQWLTAHQQSPRTTSNQPVTMASPLEAPP